MNRTDRLVALVMMLQSKSVTTAAEMASHFEITKRTVYRDIAALGESGVPIVGEPGVGYSLMRGYHLPPVMFSPKEAFALVTGALLTERMTDGSMRESIRSAIGKVTAVLPAGLQGRVERLRKNIAVGGRSPTRGAVPLSSIQQALASGYVLRLNYRGAAREAVTERIVEPVGLVFYLDHWHLIAWCRLREAVRDFRVDRIIACSTLPEPIPPRSNLSLAQYLASCLVPEIGETAVIEVPVTNLESVRRYWGPTLLDEKVNGKKVRVRIGFQANGSDCVARWILGMGTEATIIAPEMLSKRVIDLARIMARHHESKMQRTRNHS